VHVRLGWQKLGDAAGWRRRCNRSLPPLQRRRESQADDLGAPARAFVVIVVSFRISLAIIDWKRRDHGGIQGPVDVVADPRWLASSSGFATSEA
jgi:hypothetical protein